MNFAITLMLIFCIYDIRQRYNKINLGRNCRTRSSVHTIKINPSMINLIPVNLSPVRHQTPSTCLTPKIRSTRFI